MSDLIVTENMTLDGVIEATEGWFAPAGDEGQDDQSDLRAAITEQREAADAFLVGRVTFEDMRGYWPEQTDDRGPLREDIERLKAAPGNDIVATGSISLVPDLIAGGLLEAHRFRSGIVLLRYRSPY